MEYEIMSNENVLFAWSVQYLCDKQLRDVDADDVLCDGLYRKCHSYKGGGGFDEFNEIMKRRFPDFDYSAESQFVVQLRGCPLNCPYCYVTKEGIVGHHFKPVDTEKLVDDFNKSGLPVLYLTGGAPAIYMNHWAEVMERIDGKIFHSDIMLVEREYKDNFLKIMKRLGNHIFTVSIKGSTEEEFLANTGVKLDSDLFWRNMDAIVDNDLNFYFSFTNMSVQSVNNFANQVVKRYENKLDNPKSLFDDSVCIDLLQYNSLEP